MAAWVKFTANYDYRWPSGAVTAFEEGMVVNVKQEVADAAIADKAAKTTTKPKPGEDGHETSGAKLDTDRVKPAIRHVITGGHKRRARGAPLPDPSDPKATRSEPMVVKARLAAAPLPEDVAEAEDEPVASIIDTANGSPNGPVNG